MALTELAVDVAGLVEGNPRRVKNFVNGLAVGWTVLKEHGCNASFHHYLLMAYLQAYHPEAYRLLVHEPDLFEAFGQAVTQSQNHLPPDAAAVERFFHRSFRHCFPRLPEKFQPKDRKESDELVDELMARVDRYRGDSQFLKLWGREMGGTPIKELPAIFRPIVQGLGADAVGPT